MVRQPPQLPLSSEIQLFLWASSNILGEMLLNPNQANVILNHNPWLSNISQKMLLDALTKIAVSPSLEGVVGAAAPFTN